VFAPMSTVPYYALRDGSAYLPMKGTQGSLNYDIIAQRGAKAERRRRFELATDIPGSVGNDVLKAICVRKSYATDIHYKTDTDNTNVSNFNENEPDLRGLSRDRTCAVLCGKKFYYYRAKNIQGQRTYICYNDTFKKTAYSCRPRESWYNHVRYICECKDISAH